MHRLYLNVDSENPGHADVIDLTDDDLGMIEHALSRSVSFWKDEVDKGHASDLHKLAQQQHASWSALLAKLEGE